MTLNTVRSVLPGNHGLLALLTAVFFLTRLGEWQGSAPGWARCYLDDFLCLPLVLSLALVAHRFFGRSRRAVLPVSHGLLALGLFSVFFEGILPWTVSGPVADPVDVLMYLAGFLLFQFGLNRDVADPRDITDLLGV